jgi:molecular chaperone DnaK
MAAVGIDLGTTNTVCASVRGGRVNVLGDELGRRLLPSVVSFHPSGQVLVGHPAKERRVVDAKNTVASVKRLIGRSWDSDEIKRARQRFAFELKEGPGQGPLVVARGQDYTLPEISAFVLKRAKVLAEAALGEVVDRAVITVPANFNELQRAATKVAGRVAGLEILRIINEPTAAALAYGLGRSTRERIAVYDFGGGTFDCTLLDLSGNVFEVLATAGDTFLGGDDIDLAIAERMAEAFLLAHRYDPRTNPQAFERLRVAAEAVKIGLSSSDRTRANLGEVAHGLGGAPLDLDLSMTRDELEMLAAPLVERTFAVCQDALALARLPVSAFDRIILVGGSTRIPLVRRRVEQFFGKPPLDRVNPEEVVAIGAAIQAAALTEVARRRSIPAPPVPAARKILASRPSAPPLEEEEDEVTIATPFSALIAEQEKARTSSPELPPTAGRTAPPPVAAGATRTARMASAPAPAAAAASPPQAPSAPLPGPGGTQRLAPAPSREVESTLPRPLVFEDVLRAERGEAPAPGPAPEQKVSLSAAPPVLVDVTPRALVVETVGGWCDVVVQRNAKVPCERTRAFTTSSDMQTVVRVRVAQGEDATFKENTYLGQVELSDLRPAPRGQVTIQVRFEVDESGTLRVAATDVSTGREAQATLQLVGISGHESVQQMRARHTGTAIR